MAEERAKKSGSELDAVRPFRDASAALEEAVEEALGLDEDVADMVRAEASRRGSVRQTKGGKAGIEVGGFEKSKELPLARLFVRIEAMM